MKTLIVSGCSFTFEPWNWPTFVAKSLNYSLKNVGMASQGNGLIAKKVMKAVYEELLTKQKEDIIVGVMWSGIDRFDFFKKNESSIQLENKNGWVENPTAISVDMHKNWIIMNGLWSDKWDLAKLYYENFHSFEGSVINTLQNILLVQYFLKDLGIKYFMCTYMDIFGDKTQIKMHNEFDYLYKQIDFENFIPVSGCYEWVRDNYPNEGFNHYPDTNEIWGYHPLEFGHRKFAEEVILPFLKSKPYLI